MYDRRLRVVVFAPHFAEYAARLATALSSHADVLLVNEAGNLASECSGLPLVNGDAGFKHATYEADYVLRRVSPRGSLQRRRIRRAISAFAPDIVHIQEQGDRFTAAIALQLSQSHPIILTVHDPVPHSGSDALVAARFAADLALIRAAASAYHVHGAHCGTMLRRTLGTLKPILETPHGVILVPPAGHVEDGGDRYLFFGRMEAYKGLDTLLDAIDLLSPAFRFVLAGRGPELDRHRARIAAHPSIELVERFLPPLEAIHQFQRACAVLMPYRDATQSGVISAAFGNGKPVIASMVGGLVDAVTHESSGLMVPPGDSVALAAAIRAISDASTRLRLTEGAQAAAAGRFAWSAIAAQLLACYAETVALRTDTARAP